MTTPKDHGDQYVRLLDAIRAEARAGLVSPEWAVSAVQAVEQNWRKGRYTAVRQGLTAAIREAKATGDPAVAGVITIYETFRDNPEAPMLRLHCDCGGRLIKRQMVDPPETDMPSVDWRCVDCTMLYDAAGAARGKDPARSLAK